MRLVVDVRGTRRDRPPDRPADARAGRHQPRAVRRERGRRRVRDRRAGRARPASGWSRGSNTPASGSARRRRSRCRRSPSRRPGARPSSPRARRSSPARRWSPFERGRGADRRRVAGRLPARGPERAPRRAADPADARLHRRQRRPRRPRPRRQRPDAEDDPRGDPDERADGVRGTRFPGAPIPSTARCATSCSARRTTSAGCRRARSRRRRWRAAPSFDRELALAQHRELVSVYESAGVDGPHGSSPTRRCPTRCSPATRA